MAKTATLVYDFATDDGTFVDAVAGGTITGGVAEMPYTTGSTVKQTPEAWDLTESTLFAEVVHDPADASNETYFGFGTAGGLFEANQFMFVVSSLTIFYREIDGSGANSDTTGTYSATDMRWMRLRYTGTSIFWDTSPDGETWTERRTKTAVFTPSAHRVKIGGFNFAASQTTFATFDNINGGSAPGQTVAVNQVISTDTAQPIGRLKAQTVGQASEADTAAQLAKRVPVAQLTEANTAQLVESAKSKAVGQLVETSTAQTITLAAAGLVRQATETETAQPIRRAKVKAVGQPTESAVAQAITWAKSALLGQVTETAAALAVTKAKAAAVGQMVETDTATAVTAALDLPPLIADEDRTLTVQAENRTRTIHDEPRTLTIAAGRRTLTIAADQRTVAVTSETRTIRVPEGAT